MFISIFLHETSGKLTLSCRNGNARSSLSQNDNLRNTAFSQNSELVIHIAVRVLFYSTRDPSSSKMWQAFKENQCSYN